MGPRSALGFFHEYRAGRPSLACDLVEPFRVAAVDRLVLSMLARDRYNETDFIQDDRDGSVKLVEEAFKRWLMDLEAQFHACDEDHPSLQVLLVERVASWSTTFLPGPAVFPAQRVAPTAVTATRTMARTASAMMVEMYTTKREKPREFRSLGGSETAPQWVHLGLSRNVRQSSTLRRAHPRPSSPGTHKSQLISEHPGLCPFQTIATHGVMESTAARGIARIKGFETGRELHGEARLPARAASPASRALKPL